MHPYVRSGLMTLGVVTALALLVGGFLAADTEDFSLPDEVERIEPSNGELISAQADVGADLADDHTGVLMVDGVEIPEDQLTRVEPLGQLFFRPGEGREIERFEAGTHSATVLYWRRTGTRSSAQSTTWQFRVGH